MKVIAAIDLMDGKVVRLLRGRPQDRTVYSSEPVLVAKKWEEAGADFLHVVDLDATLGRGSNLSMIKRISAETVIPVQVAGGLRTESLADEAMGCSERIVLGTMAFDDCDTLKKIAARYGHDRIVISVDHVGKSIMVNGWQRDTGVNLFEGMRGFLKAGFTEFLLTNVDRDGAMCGPDLACLKDACAIAGANVIASGGISGIGDLAPVRDCNASGVILGRALYENKITIEEAKKIA